jgi:hypothetical protein
MLNSPTRTFTGWFAGLIRRCPKCGGQLHRCFSFLDKMGLFIPLPHTIYARHQCEKCAARFRSYRSLTDLFLELSWFSAGVYLGEFRLLALTCPLTWLIASRVMGKSNWDAGNDTIAAGILTGILWFLALIFGGGMRYGHLINHPLLAVPLLCLFIFAPIGIVLVLDRYTTFGLTELDGDEPRRG